jgi:hypothetical protein
MTNDDKGRAATRLLIAGPFWITPRKRRPSTRGPRHAAQHSDGTVHLSSDFSSPSLTLATHYYVCSSTFTLSNADILRTLPQAIVTVTVANGVATVAIDRGKDGTIDSTFTVPQLVAAAG